MNCRVVVEAAVPVYDVETADEAVRISISKTGEMLNPDLNYVEINMGERTSPSGEELPPAFIAADEALVALELEMTVFNVEREEHAARIARKEIGQRLENIPLDVLEIEVLEEDDEDDDADDEPVEEDETDEAETDEAETDEAETDEAETDEAETDEAETDEAETDDDTRQDDSDEPDFNETTVERTAGEDDEVLPEFEELIDE